MSCWEEICTHDEDGILEELLTIDKFDPNTIDELGISALQYVVKNGSVKCLKLLLRAPEIKINLQNLAGETALHFAFRYNDNDTVAYEMRSMLDKAGADKSIRDNHNNLPKECLDRGFPELDELFDAIDKGLDLLEEEESGHDNDYELYHLREALVERVMEWTDDHKVAATKLSKTLL
ncbi:hypothetical protein BY458DRAFT_498877 [Sporodiniella umbellata]|nr:hypothetical protein BY458DRAFT_498877 [Sporodiniella umbellata]